MVVLLIRVVHVPGSEPLQVDQVAPLVGSPDPLDLNTACNLDLLPFSVDDLRHLQSQLLPADLLHYIVEMFTCKYSLVLIDTAILGERCQIVVVQYAGDDALCNNSVAPVVDHCSGKNVEALAVQDLKGPQAQEVVVRLSEAWVVLGGGQIAEWTLSFYSTSEVHCVREEDLVVDEHLLTRALIGVQRGEVTTDYPYCSFHCGIEEVVVYFCNGSIALHALQEGLFGEVLDHLELLIPVADSAGIKAVQRKQGGVIRG